MTAWLQPEFRDKLHSVGNTIEIPLHDPPTHLQGKIPTAVQ